MNCYTFWKKTFWNLNRCLHIQSKFMPPFSPSPFEIEKTKNSKFMQFGMILNHGKEEIKILKYNS